MTALSLLSDSFRGQYRIRLQFSSALAAGAFTVPSMYSVSTADNQGASPITVVSLFAISSDPNSVEIAINSPFAQGCLYTVLCTSVPPVSGTSFTGTITDRFPQATTAYQNVEPETSDYFLILYNRDVQWDGSDFDETASGDLQTVSGRPNWKGAMNRRVVSYGVQWDTSYGGKTGQFVDAPSPMQTSLAGALLSQARLDNRTRSASISVVENTADPVGGSWFLDMHLVGIDGLGTITVSSPVPVSST